MTAAYRSHTVDEFYTLATVTLDKPASVASGDVLLAWFVNNDGSRVLNTLPSGWTLIASATTTSAPSTGAWLCKKVAGGSEPATYDFVFNYDFNGRAAIVAYQSGSDVSVYGTASAADAGSSTPYNVAAAAITVPDNDSKLVFFGAGRFTTTGSAPAFTPPASYTERIDSGASYDPRALTVADITQASAGSSGAVTGTVARTSAGAARTVGVLVAIAPVGGSSTISLSGEADCPVVHSVSIASTTASVPAGNYTDVTATVRDQASTALAGLTGSAASADTGVATVALLAASDSAGQSTLRITGVAPGQSAVTATFDGVVSNTVTATVTDAGSAATISPQTASLTQGQTQQFVAALSGDDTATWTWSVASGSGTVSSAGLYTAPASDTVAVVKAALSTDANIYATATVTVAGAQSGTTTVSSTWVFSGAAYASQPLDYIVKSADNTILASGTATTNASGVLTVSISAAYSGQKVLVHVENVGSAMTTAGKVHGTQVVTAA